MSRAGAQSVFVVTVTGCDGRSLVPSEPTNKLKHTDVRQADAGNQIYCPGSEKDV